MKQKRVVWYLVGVIVIAALVMIVVAAQPVANATAARASAQTLGAKALSFDLKCNIKIPGGLAQCGSQASSCKNCHEVKGEDAVNAKGDWHVSHAFGDFCEFCHGGNVQATDQDAAHQGLVEPLGDVKANCSACHASDYQAKAETYATALGVKVGSGSGGAPPPAPQQPAQPQPPASQPPAQTVPQTAPKPAASTAKSSGAIVDYARPAGISAGNVIVGGLLVITVGGGSAFVYWNEKRLRRLAAPKAAAASSIAAQPTEVSVTSIDQLPPDAIKLLPTLKELDPRTLRALRIILSDRQRGEERLQSLSLINFTVLEEMKRLDKKELSLLLALAAES